MEKVCIYFTSGSVSSDEMIRHCASHYTGTDCSGMKMIRERGKKPLADREGLHFSVSHSGGVWICAFAEQEVGCDLQERRENPKYKKLAARWFSENEAERTLTECDFCDIWARKEAYVKFLGTGIDENFRRFDSFSLRDAVMRDFTIPGAEDRFSAAAAMRDEFEIDFFNINKI